MSLPELLYPHLSCLVFSCLTMTCLSMTCLRMTCLVFSCLPLNDSYPGEVPILLPSSFIFFFVLILFIFFLFLFFISTISIFSHLFHYFFFCQHFRDPYDSIWSEFQRRVSSSHVGGTYVHVIDEKDILIIPYVKKAQHASLFQI